MTGTPPHAPKQNPLFRPEDGGFGIRVHMEDPAVIRHEVLFEEGDRRVGDRPVYVGTGIPYRRLMVGVVCAFTILGLLLIRAAWMQFVEGAEYRSRADANRFRVDILPARRGVIRDRNGVVLARNTPSFQLNMRWSDLPVHPDDRERTIAFAARTVGLTTDEVLSALATTGTRADEWIEIAKDVSYDRAIALSVKLPELSGVSLVTTAKRDYPRSNEIPSLSHILGYVGTVSPEEYAAYRSKGYRRNDEIGKTGVEFSYESRIRGRAGERRIEVDSLGRPRAVAGDLPPVDGHDVRLTIDVELQAATERALRRGMERARVTRGSAIVLDPRDGSVLALVALPTYDNNAFAGRVSSTVYGALIKNEDRPLFPRAWAGQFPSGSVIKPLIATAALAEGVITPNTTVHSVGGIQVGPWFFPDWRAGGHGTVNVRTAIAWSVNSFFYYVGGGYDAFLGLGVDRLTAWMRRFGLGEKTGLDLPNEATGHVPSQEWKEKTKGERWYIGDTYNLSIGQGDLLVTPVQMARVTGVIANGGRAITPHLLESATTTADTAFPGVRIADSIWTIVQQGMRDTVVYGSGRALNTLPIAVAGKTGTAQWRADKPTHAWFTGFAPYGDPRIIVTVLLEEGGEGSSSAVPVAGEIFRAWAASQTSSRH
jgi:penicillin-binding protein 2